MNAKSKFIVVSTLLIIAGMVVSGCGPAVPQAPPPPLPQGWKLMTSGGQIVAVTALPPQGNYWYLQFPTEAAARQALGEGIAAASVYAAAAGAWVFKGVILIGAANIFMNGGAIIQQLAEGPAELRVEDRVIYLNRVTGQVTGFYDLNPEKVQELTEGKTEVKVQEHESPQMPTPQPTRIPKWKPGDPRPAKGTAEWDQYLDYYGRFDPDKGVEEARQIISGWKPGTKLPFVDGELRSTGGYIRVMVEHDGRVFITGSQGDEAFWRLAQYIAENLGGTAIP